MIVSPSILSADFSRLGQQLKEIEDAGAEWVHFDVFDGNFVKNISFGPDIMRAVKRSTSLYVDTHLVVNDPEFYASVFLDAGANGITFHLDAINDVDRSMRLIESIKARGAKAGIVLNPEANVREYLPFLDQVDLVLVMSIIPGFGGQPFREDTVERVTWLDDYRNNHDFSYLIEVDGGINAETGKRCADAGADALVAGSYVFKNDVKQAIASLHEIG